MQIGLSLNVINYISKKRNESRWLLNWRINSYYCLLNKKIPKWSFLFFENNFYKIKFYSFPKNIYKVYAEYNNLGLSLHRKNFGIDAIFNSVSIYTSIIKELKKLGIIFLSFSKAVISYSKLIKRFLGSVISHNDNYYSSLNSSSFTDGTFIYIPKNIKCPLNLSTYFRINESNLGQFERTLIILDKNSSAVYIENCTARKSNFITIHAAIVELILFEYSELKYITIQNWYSGTDRFNGVYNFVSKRCFCYGKYSKITWIQIETGSSITWKYPSSILIGNNSSSEFYSLNITNRFQQLESGTKIYHIGKNTKSSIYSKSILLCNSINIFRSLIDVNNKSFHSKNISKCDSLITGSCCINNNIPTINIKCNLISVEYEALTNSITKKQLLYCFQRNVNYNNTLRLMINGYNYEITKNLPFEISIEVNKLLLEIF